MGRININDLDRYTNEKQRPRKNRKVKKMKPTSEERPVTKHSK
tara:strand:- start:2051 stop:2179 length:129 start_codon:yes stop_codon:yes gene_type:complete